MPTRAHRQADRVLSPSATEPLQVSAHSGNAPLRDTLLSLAARCEAATGPDRSLDANIGFCCGLDTGLRERRHFIRAVCADETTCPEYTGSLDAAQSLAPERLTLSLQRRFNWNAEVGYANTGNALTGALALCAAALRAIAQNVSPPDTKGDI
jgi:hypothetical protein